MSNIDHFIEEVTEEVRRDRLFKLMKRYGWIAILAVILLVGGAAVNEWRKARAEARAQALGDAILAALEADDPAERAGRLADVSADSPAAEGIVLMLRAGQLAEAGDAEAAAALFEEVARNGDLPEAYRRIAAFRGLLARADFAPADELRAGFSALAVPGSPVRVLAEEQIALLDVREGDRQAAIDRLNAVLIDSEASAGLRQRASQLIVALGGTPEPAPALSTADSG